MGKPRRLISAGLSHIQLLLDFSQTLFNDLNSVLIGCMLFRVHFQVTETLKSFEVPGKALCFPFNSIHSCHDNAFRCPPMRYMVPYY